MGFPLKHLTEEARRRARISAQLKHRYGITIDDYERMEEAQQFRCAICDVSTHLHVDHDHATGKVRGLLCGNCNKALGFVDSAGLAPIIDYLCSVPAVWEND